MPRFLRTVRQSRWQAPEWLGPGVAEVKADALADLQTVNNLLSVYLVESARDVDRIAVALAATRDNLQNVDYVVFDGKGLQDIGVEAMRSSGNTPDYLVNEMHYDIGKLTARQTADLAAVIIKGNVGRCQRMVVKAGMKRAIQCGDLDDTAMKEQLLRQLH